MGKAVAINDTDGMIKTIFDEGDWRAFGAHMIGPGVTEMIQGFAVAMSLETTEADLMVQSFRIQRYQKRCTNQFCLRLEERLIYRGASDEHEFCERIRGKKSRRDCYPRCKPIVNLG